MANTPARRMSVFQMMAELYAELDHVANTVAQQVKVSCAKGCANCCYLLTMATTVEAVNIAGYLLRFLKKDEFEKAMMELRSAARKADYPGINNTSYFRLQIACPFLTQDRLCSIYPVRPAACRYHYVISPKENCSPVALDATTRAIDLRELEEEVFDFDMKVRGNNPLLAPLPTMVLFAMKGLLGASHTKESDEFLDIVEKAIQGIATPEEWLSKHAVSVTTSTIRGTSKPIPIQPVLTTR